MVLLGQSEFEAADVTLSGDLTFVVPDGHRLSLSSNADGSVRSSLTPLAPAAPASGSEGSGGYEPSWEWHYAMDEVGAVRLLYTNAGVTVPPGTGITGMTLATAEAAVAARQGKKVAIDFTI